MQISRDDWKKYIGRLSAVNQKAAQVMQAWMDENPNAETEDLIATAFAVSDHYGEAAASLACEMYDETAEAQGASVPSAEPAETATYSEVEKAVRGTLKNRCSTVPATVGRLVKQAGADTTLKNARRDGAEWAWVPMGDTCAFCLTLASRGWQKQSEKAGKGGHAEHIHANCDCEYAVRFDGKSAVAGYDPDKYLEMYENAEGNTSQEKINSMRREQYAQNKDRINEQKRIAYARSKEAPIAEAKKISLPQKGNSGILDASTPAIKPVTWDASSGPETWTDKQRKAMWNAEWSSTYKKTETARLYGGDGKQIFKKDGSTSEVIFSRTEIKKMKGGVLTHNHPNGGCFSPEDVNMLRHGKLQEIRAVTKSGVYRLQQPTNWPKEIDSLETIRSRRLEIDKNVSKAIYDRARMGELSYSEAEQLSQRATTEAFCEQYGIPFSFETWDSIREALRK